MKIESFQMFPLLRSVILEEALPQRGREGLLLEDSSHLRSLLREAKRHDLAHLLAEGLLLNRLADAQDPAFSGAQQEQFLAVFRYEKLNYALGEVSRLLEEEQIPFLPLKGSVLRQYYPKPWMRTSCDIDILVQEVDLDRAAALLCERLSYENRGKDAHDVSLFSPDGQHLELHYDLVEEGRAKSARKILGSVWEMAVPKDGCRYHMEMPDELFYFYHVAHMAKHFELGGCGIRPLLDLWILDRRAPQNRTAQDALLRRGGLLTFADAARKLSRVWFEGEEHSTLSKEMESFILRGGVYGTTENRVEVQQQKTGGKWKYAMQKIFLPYRKLKYHYPILEKHPWLTPVMEVRRWCKLLFGGQARRGMRELQYNRNVTGDKALATARLLDDLGL